MITAPSTVIPSSIVWRARYFERVRSPEWRQLKATLTRYRGPYCQRCHDIAPLELHHKHYTTVGCEGPEDVELLCSRCHAEADRERAAEGQRRAAEGIYNTGLNTYATKKYGERWQDWLDREQVGREFDAWLRRKQTAVR